MQILSEHMKLLPRCMKIPSFVVDTGTGTLTHIDRHVLTQAHTHAHTLRADMPHPLLAALGQDDNDAPLPAAACAAHALDQADGALLRVKAHDQVHLADVQSLLTHTRGHQRVEATFFKPPHNLHDSRIVTVTYGYYK